MTPESRFEFSPRSQSAHGLLGFDPWTAEIATREQAALNIARLVYRLVELVSDGFAILAEGVQKLRTACPIEIEPVKIARPAQAEVTSSVDRAAA